MLLLFSPLSIASSLSLTTSPLDTLLIILAVRAASKGLTSVASLCFVCSSLLSLYPLLLSLPVLVLLSQSSRLTSSTNESSAILSSTSAAAPISSSSLLAFVAWSLLSLAAIAALCSSLLQNHGGTYQILPEVYLFLLRVEDLSPNLGFSWYFFTEMFERERDFFHVLINSIPLLLTPPLFLRLHRHPFFLLLSLLCLTTLIKPYPSIADFALIMAFIPFSLRYLTKLRFGFVCFFGLLYVLIMGPVMFHLWIQKGISNANFYFAVSLVSSCVQSLFLVESVRCVMEWDRQEKAVKRSEELKKKD